MPAAGCAPSSGCAPAPGSRRWCWTRLAQLASFSVASFLAPGSMKGMIAASGLSSASNPAAPALPASLPSSSDTAGWPKVPLTWTGVRSVNGLKSLGETTARRSRLSSRSDTVPSIQIVESFVLTTMTFGRAMPLATSRSATLHRIGSASSPLTTMPSAWATSSPPTSTARCEIAPSRMCMRMSPSRRRQDLGRRAAAALDLDQRVELARDIGRRIALALQAQPLRQVEAEQAQVGGPEGALAAAVELQVAGELALRGDALEVGDRQHAVGEEQMRAPRPQRLDQVGAGIEHGDVDQDVGVHRAQRRQVELLVGKDPSRRRDLARGGIAAARRRRADRRAQVGEQDARAAEPAGEQRHLASRVVRERAVEMARADVGRVEYRFPEAGILDQPAVGLERRRRRQGDAERVTDRRQRRPGEVEAALQAGEVERIGGAAVEAEARPADRRAQRQRLRLRVLALLQQAEHAGRAQVDEDRKLLVLAGGLETQAFLAGREANVRGDRRSACRGAAGANEDAAARRAARRRSRYRQARRCPRRPPGSAVLPSLRAKRASIAGRQDLVGVHQVAVADAQHARRSAAPTDARSCRHPVFLPNCHEARPSAQPLEVAVELARLERTHAQRPAAPGAPEVEVAELQARVVGEQHVRLLAPGGRTELDRIGSDAHAADQADAHSRRIRPRRCRRRPGDRASG